jgi:choline dehydrogenase
MSKIWDYIIVGAGSSGCVMANRLSENPQVSVLLIEAGGSDTSPSIHMPRGFVKALTTPDLIWRYPTSPNPGFPAETWVRGRTLGGSSSVNGLVHVRGDARDYDEWEANGCTGWGWEDLEPCFLALENLAYGAAAGRRGVLHTSTAPKGQILCEAFLNSCMEMQIPLQENQNDRFQTGVGYAQRTIWHGRRQNAAKAFLHPALSRPNLTLLKRHIVNHIIFEGSKASGVQVSSNAGQEIYNAKELILCAGAIATPQILLRSGIGPGQDLAALGIPVAAHNPGVGQNLCEHHYMHFQFRTKGGSTNSAFRGVGLILSLLQYYLIRTGPLAQAASEVNGFVRTRPDLPRPNAQIMMSPISIDRKATGYKTENAPGFICGTCLTRPESRGSIKLSSVNPDDPPIINPNYLDMESDQRNSIDLARLVRRLAQQPALQPFTVGEVWPGPERVSDEDILNSFRQYGRAGYHAAGTCRMGSDNASVVDLQLRVRGINGLRVGDISIMPSLISGNTNAAAMALAWRGADLIKNT